MAAGLGTRLRGYMQETPKPLIRVLDIPLIIYPVANLLRKGVRKLYIVVNRGNYELIKALFTQTEIDVDFVINSYPERGNGYSLYLGMSRVRGENFYLVMSDHIHHPSIFDLMHAHVGCGEVLVCVDSKPAYIDVGEATKVLIKDFMLCDIGKALQNYTHVDTGLFIIQSSLYKYINKYCKENLTVEVSGLIKYLISVNRKVLGIDVSGAGWLEIDTIEDLKRAESEAKGLIQEILNTLSSTIKLVYKP